MSKAARRHIEILHYFMDKIDCNFMDIPYFLHSA